jgi:hypothetical protein
VYLREVKRTLAYEEGRKYRISQNFIFLVRIVSSFEIFYVLSCVAQAGFELVILLFRSPKCWDCRYKPPCLAQNF